MNAAWLYVGLVYAATVWLARRAGIDLPRRIALLFYLLVLLVLFRPLTGQYADFPADVARLVAPWSVTNPIDRNSVSNAEMQDITMQIVPWTHQVREAWRSGRVPLWNALSGAGHPLLANGQSAALSPLRLIALPLPLAPSIAAEGAMKFLIALTFTYLFARRLYGIVPSLAAAISFGLGSFIAVWLHFPLGTAGAFFPAVIYSADRLFEKRTAGRLTVFVLIAASTIFAGHPETAAHIAFFTLLYLIWVAILERRFRSFGPIVAAAVLALLVASPFVVPFIDAVRDSRRFHEIDKGERGVIAYSDPKCAVLLIAPRFYGDPRSPDKWGPAFAESITGFAGILGLAGCIAVIARAVMLRTWRTRELFFALIAFVIFLITLDWAPVSAPFRALFSFSANARVRFAFAFFVAMAAAAALDAAMRERKTPLLIGIGSAAGVLGALLIWSRFPLQSFLVTLPSIAVLTAALFIRRAPAIVLCAIAFEIIFATHDWRPDVSTEELYPRTPIIDAVTRLNQRGSNDPPFRFTGINSPLFPNTHAMFGIEDPRVHDPMVNDAYVRILGIATEYEEDAYFRKLVDPNAAILNYLNVRYLITEPGVDLPHWDRFTRIYDGKDGRIYENQHVLPRFFPIRNVFVEGTDESFERNIRRSQWHDHAFVRSLPVDNDAVARDLLAPRPEHAPEPTLRITKAEGADFRMTVDAPRYTLIVSSQTFWSEWRVETATKRLRALRVNGAFLGFIVPPGVSEIRVHYFPLKFYVSAVVSLLTLMALIALCVREYHPRRV